MSIFINNTKNLEFHLTNGNISYIISVLKNKHIGNLYFGKAIKHRDDFSHLMVHRSCVLAPAIYEDDMDFSLETSRLEYPVFGKGDYRSEAFRISDSLNRITNNPIFQSYKIYKGKEEIKGLPSTYTTDENEITTLELLLEDKVQNYQIILKYHLFEKLNSISRSTTFINKSNDVLSLNKALSFNIDFDNNDFNLITLDGVWARERHVNERSLLPGTVKIESLRGASSANHNPSLILKDKNCDDENVNEAYGFSLIYSGNFEANVQLDNYKNTRVQMGINSSTFNWILDKDEIFNTPEVLICYSDKGINSLSNTFHKTITKHVMKSKYHDKVRPILLNNWEGTYFDFDEEKLINLATKAKEVGVELFVLDDGWFGKRDDDTTSLGDWYTNLKKLPNGIENLAKSIKDLGLKFGLWFEPEMVNIESELYKTHPTWIINTPNRFSCYGRNQFVLDYSNPEIVDYIYEKMAAIISKTNLDYIKWDMNRNITEPYSAILSPKKQGEFFHRYILGVYKLYEKLTTTFPNVLFESCASGGGRFDLGMMYYAPQAWCSDDTDATERLKIQYGTSLVYPINSMGSHVSAIPNHQVGRNTSLKFRGDVAYFGTFGYELDITKSNEKEINEMKNQIKFYKKYRELIQYGDFIRLESPFKNSTCSWMVISKDKKTAILAYYKILATPNPPLNKIKLKGLDDDIAYEINGTVYYGDELMNIGFNLEIPFNGTMRSEYYKGKITPGTDFGDFTSQIYVLKAKN
ncbi:MAG: alpha-galactosidase [Pleomorphochaeta sp.]